MNDEVIRSIFKLNCNGELFGKWHDGQFCQNGDFIKVEMWKGFYKSLLVEGEEVFFPRIVYLAKNPYS